MLVKRIKRLVKQTLILTVCVSLVTTSISSSAAEEKSMSINGYQLDQHYIDVLAIPTVRTKTVQEIVGAYKYSARQGHGFAAERGNNLADRIKGKNAIIVGNDNIKNGADRVIINRDGTKIYIQDKYYADARSGINACFDADGNFRYVDANGHPMQIEVPKEQYAEAVEIMKQKIKEGKIPHVSDPDEAETLVRKGALTYKQAKNLAKAGTIESLKYDAKTGVISAASAFGISTVLNYAVYRFNGVDRKEAITIAAEEGLKTGMLAFGAHIIASQLGKTGLKEVFRPSSEALMKALGEDFAKRLLSATGERLILEAGESTAEAITRTAARAFRANIIFDVVAMVVFTVPDAIDMFQGRISKKQFVKNFAVIAVSTVAASGGYLLGAMLVPGVGSIPVGIVVSIVSGGVAGWGADKLADYITDDDADEMYVILQEQFAQNCEDYLINEEEAERIVEVLNKKLDDDMFKSMYQSKDRPQFANELLTSMFEEEVAKRDEIVPPTEEELRESLLSQLEGVVFIH